MNEWRKKNEISTCNYVNVAVFIQIRRFSFFSLPILNHLAVPSVYVSFFFIQSWRNCIVLIYNRCLYLRTVCKIYCLTEINNESAHNIHSAMKISYVNMIWVFIWIPLSLCALCDCINDAIEDLASYWYEYQTMSIIKIIFRSIF